MSEAYYSKHLFKDEARQAALRGIEQLTEIVKVTLGPESESVMLSRLNLVNNEKYELGIIDDGHIAAEQVWLEDMFEREGSELIKEAARRQATSVGDGTTATIILGYAILKEAMRFIANGEKTKPLRRGLNEATELVKQELDRMAKPIKTKDQLIQVASISSSDNKDLGPKIGSLFWELGPDGIVTVEESHDVETFIERQEGMQFNQGYLDSVFVTNPARMEATVDNTYVLLTDREIVNAEDIGMIVLDLAKKGKTRIVFIAQDIKGTALEFIVDNKYKGRIQSIAIKAPLFADKQTDLLEDIAVLTGGRVISKKSGFTWEDISADYDSYLGYATRISVTKESTVIVSSAASKKEIKERVANIREQLKESTRSDFDKEKIRERIAKLTGGAGVVRIGGYTDKERGERHEKAVDAVAATPAALAEGIVQGGEMALYRARDVLAPFDLPAYRILYKALEKPLAQLLENSGYELGEYREKLSKSPELGVDVTTGDVVDMIQAGIIDPVKVPKMALSHAVSIAGLVINTGSIITHYGDKVKDMSGANN